MRTVRIDYYATYYGIELRDVIENRKNQDIRFEQGEILYVAKSLINFGAYLQSNLYVLCLRSYNSLRNVQIQKYFHE